MKTMSVRDVRQKWPEAERALAVEGEIVITRDSKPVAKLVPYTPATPQDRPRFDAAGHLRWLEEFWAQQPGRPDTDEELARERAEREL